MGKEKAKIVKTILIAGFLLFANLANAKNLTDYQFCHHHKFTYYFLKIYDIYLCNDQNYNINSDKVFAQDFAIIIKYNINIKKEKFTTSSMEEILRYYALNKQKQKEYYQKLIEIFPDVKPEDQITASYKKEGRIVFYFNTKEVGQINDAEFARIFLNIWLHPNAHYQDMRNDLIK